ncbi:hypothetical protein J8J14_18925 [Roseomonas sp. SSH11]|uniref:DUF222 domain-containing protein n=1 Tax=Pararoseomonas baculiformis TaxID=2820812 RepID=A0ABS4AIM8_9PROT|nr:hypothetical protein [Pararoseomonas baculiformis]MBP0446853.1 hypothetical protein [Pararoseomonas baculiformis]
MSTVTPFPRRQTPSLTIEDVEALGTAISRYALARVAAALPGLSEADSRRAGAMEWSAIEDAEEAIRAIDARHGRGAGEDLTRLIRSELVTKLAADEARAAEWDALDAGTGN